MSGVNSINNAGTNRVTEFIDDETPVLSRPEGFPGQIQLVDFEKLRAHLGEDWPHNKARIHDAVNDLLRRELGPWDFSTMIGQEHVLIIYGDDNLSTSQRIAGKIGEQIEAELGGGYHSLLMDIRPGDKKIARKIVGELNTPQTNPEVSAKRYARQGNWEAIPSQARRPAPTDSANTLAGLTESFRKPVTRQEVGYAPMWNVRQEVLTGYAIVPVVRSQNMPTITSYNVLGQPATLADIQTLDVEMLRTQIEVGAELVRNNFTSLLVSQVHSDTLSFVSSRKEVLQIAQQIPPQLKNTLMVQIVGTMENTPATTITQRIGGLNKYFRAMIIRVPSINFPIDRCRDAGATAVSYIVPPNQSDDQIVSDAKRVIAQAQMHRLLTCFEYVPTVKLAVRLKEAGAVFVTGACAGEIEEAPGNMQHLKVKNAELRQTARY
ncbi:MAG: hypothetical protein RLN89_07310 [Parvibaculum sp.]